MRAWLRGRPRFRVLGIVGVVAAVLVTAMAAAWAQSNSQRREWPRSDRPPAQDRHHDDAAERDRARAKDRERERRSADARRERERSRTAYSGDSVDGRKLAKDVFGGVFAEPAWQGPRLKAGERVRRYLAQDAFLVDRPRGADLLVESLTPLLYDTPSGGRRRIDTRLASDGATLRPAAAPSEVAIARSAAGGVTLPRSGAAFQVEGASATAEVDDDKAFFTDALEDTDLAVAALPDGVAALMQLRSARSPESVSLDFDLPEGTSIRLARWGGDGGPRSENVGAEVVKDGQVIATIAPPRAWDADRERIPAEYELNQDELTIRVPHRDGDWRYPLLLDPYVTENYLWHQTPTDRNRWDYGYSQGGFVFHDCTPADMWWCDTGTGLSGRALYVEAPPQGYFNGARGEWYWQAPNGSSIVRVDWHHGHTARNSCVYAHILGPNDQKQGSYVDWCGDRAPAQWATSCTAHPDCSTNGSSPGNWAIFGLRMYNGTFWSAWAQLRNVQIALWEGYRPTATAISPEPPTGWVDRFQMSFSATGKDPGLGLKKIVAGPGPDPIQERELTCAGDRTNPCPKDPETATLPRAGDPRGQYTVNTTNWPEGRHVLELVAVDVIGNPSTGSGSLQRTIKVDHNPPTLTASGTLPQYDGKVVTGPAYTLGGTADDAYSGAQEIRIFVNDGSGDVEQGSSPPPCVGDGCSMTRPLWTFAPARDGLYTITLRAKDKYGHSTEKVYRVIVDRDPPTLSVNHSGLSSAWTTAANITTTENGSDAGSGVQVAELVLPRATRRENFATCTGEVASRCPTSASKSFSYSDADLDEGTNTITGRVYDAIGRASAAETWQVKIDKFAPRFASFSGAMAKPGGWINDTSLTVEAADSASGVARNTIAIDPPGGPSDTKTNQKADGTPCDANSGCAGALTHTYSPNLSDGAHQVKVTAQDAVGRTTTDEWPVKIDRTKPADPVVTGDIAADGADVRAGIHTLHVDARDAHSGVKKVEFLVDGESQAVYEPPECTPAGCPTSASTDFKYDTENFENGRRRLEVVVTDLAGNAPSVRSWTIAQDGTSPVSLITGSLWESDGATLTEGEHGLEYTARDGDEDFPQSGLARVEITVDDEPVFSSSACAGQACALEIPWRFRPADYAEGDHHIEILTTDEAGNTEVDEIDVVVEHVPVLPPDNIELDASGATRIDGAASGDEAGRSVASVGDVNGDGLDDHAIGAPCADHAGVDSGSVYVVYGGSYGATLDLADLGTSGGPQGFRIDGASLAELAGWSVAPVGDVNGDRLGDLAIGAPRATPPLAIANLRPSVYVLFGDPSPDSVVRLADVGAAEGPDGFRVIGPALDIGGLPPVGTCRPASSFGTSVASRETGEYGLRADLNGDRFEDLVIGSANDDNTGGSDSGSAYAVFGKADPAPVDVTALGGAGFRIDGDAPGHRAGTAATIVGDVNDDELDDLVVTAPGANHELRANAGTAYVVFGRGPGADVDLGSLDGQGYPIYGDTGDHIGTSVASLGDTDGDYFADFALGGHGAWVLGGRGGTATGPIDLADPGSYEGYEYVAPPGPEYDTGRVFGGSDVNEDDVPDVLLGFPDAPSDRAGAGELHPLYGQALDGPDRPIGGLQGQLGARMLAPTGGDAAGYSADGVEWAVSEEEAGVLVAAPGASPNPDGAPLARSRAGSVYMVRSSRLAGDDPDARMDLDPSQAQDPEFECVTRRHKGEYKRRTRPPCHSGRVVKNVAIDIPTARVPLGYGKDHRGRRDVNEVGRRHRRGNARADVERRLRNRTTIYDSLGEPVLDIEEPRKGTFRLWDPGATLPRVARRKNAKLQVIAQGCMKSKQDTRDHIIVGLMNVYDQHAIRGFMPKSALRGVIDLSRIRGEPTTRCGLGRIHYNDVADPGPYPAPGTHSHQGFRDRLTQGAPQNKSEDHIHPLELYQGPHAVKKARKEGNPDIGETISNYEQPRQIRRPDRALVERTDVAYVTISSTQTHGGGLVRALVRTTAAGSGATPFRKLDEIGYTDTNVPCNNKNAGNTPRRHRQFVARWVYGNFNPNPAKDNPATPEDEGENAIYGWIPLRIPYSPPQYRDRRFRCAA